jgi:hypothetical protein
VKQLLVLLLVLVVVTGGVGYYLGWFRFSTSKDTDTGERNVEMKVDTNKMKADAEKAKEKLGSATEKDKTSTEEK